MKSDTVRAPVHSLFENEHVCTRDSGGIVANEKKRQG